MHVSPARTDPWPVAGVACAIGFIVLAFLVNRLGGLAFDVPIAAAVQGLPIPVGLWEACTELGGVILLPIGIAFALGALLFGRIRLALIVAVILIASAFFTDLVKDYVARPRPSGALVPAAGYSFPSGHTVSSTATYGLLAVVAWRSRLALAARWSAVVAGVALPLLIGVSRIALGVHYPTDVLGGWLAGTVFVAVAATLVRVTDAMARDWPRAGGQLPGTDP
jgi:undecaprenyl-diphosphatase